MLAGVTVATATWILSQLPHEGDQIGLLLSVELKAKDQVEQRHRIFEGEQSPVVEVERAVLDSAQGEGLDRPPRRSAGSRAFSVPSIDRVVGLRFHFVPLD
jgi:hypothetical protein